MQNIDDAPKRARSALEGVLPAMNKLRDTLDHIEGHVDARDWPLATYKDMLFEKH